MPIISDQQLGKDIRSSRIERCYFLYGKEQFHIDKAVTAIIRKVVPAKDEQFCLERFDDKASVSDINAAVTAISMFAQSKCVVVRDLNLSQRGEDELDLLIETVQETAEDAVLILYYTEVQPDLRAAKVKKLMDAFAKL